jgi:hypothetical protein
MRNSQNSMVKMMGVVVMVAAMTIVDSEVLVVMAVIVMMVMSGARSVFRLLWLSVH